MTHTPGPWRVTAAVFPFEVVSDGPSVLIADVGPNNVPVALSNANLIAAAPELINRLQSLVFAIEEGISLTKNHAAYVESKKTLARAIGEVI